MKRISLLLLCVFTFMTMNNSAYAGKRGMIGKVEKLHKIQDIDMKGQAGETLYLGKMTKSYFFILGVYMQEEGYAIGINGNDDAYYPMPEGEQLQKLQAAGMLPKEMPELTLSWTEYAWGFSMWILLALSGLYVMVTKLFRKS